MAGRMKYRAKNVAKLPRFDPERSARAGVEILEKAGVGFALAGRVAVWTYLPPDQQAYTKDVDFAVLHKDMGKVASAVSAAGLTGKPMEIGGLAVRSGDVSVDFVDRHPDLEELFASAIRAAQRRGPRAIVGRRRIPVVPKDYLIAMKIATMEEKDEKDAERLILTVAQTEYGRLRSLIRKSLGPVLAMRLDVIARRAGHPSAKSSLHERHA